MKEKKININGLRELLLVGVVLLLCVVWTIMNPQFLSVNNITNILRQASYTAIAAVGMTMIIIIGEIDLSAGSLVCAAGLVGAVVCKNTNNVLLAIFGSNSCWCFSWSLQWSSLCCWMFAWLYCYTGKYDNPQRFGIYYNWWEFNCMVK